MEKERKRSPRVTLTKKDIESEVGSELLELIEEVAEDGHLSESEIEGLKVWLDNIPTNTHIYAVAFLKELINDALQDGVIDQEEMSQIHYGILRALPKEKREIAVLEKRKRDYIKWQEEDKIRQKKWDEQFRRQNLATERQREYIEYLGGICLPNTTKDEASDIIDELVSKRPTARQTMVLRFWNRLDLSNSSIDEVSEWLDCWYDEDPDRLLAWELWKKENGDTGERRRELINTVPIGAGVRYLEGIKNSKRSAQYRNSSFLYITLFLIILTAMVFLLL